MKSLIALFIMSFSVLASAAPTKLVFFETLSGDYKNDGNYLDKVPSTVEAPIATAWLTLTAVCFEGNASDVPAIVKAMIAQDAAEGLNYFKLLDTYLLGVDTTSVGDPVVLQNLQLTYKEDGATYIFTLDYVRPCNRVSKSK